MDLKRQGGLRQAAWMNDLLIAVNVLVFVLESAGAGRGRGLEHMYRAGALYAPLLFKGQGFYRLVTSIFLHADAGHLFNNMIVQFAGGEIVEKNVGHIRYGILYLLCGIGGNLASVLYDFLTREYGYSVGASGAVFGIIGALLFMILREADRMRSNSWKMDRPMKSLLIRAGIMTAYLLYSGWTNPVVNQAAHVGGLIFGFVLSMAMAPHIRSDLSDLL